MAATPSLQLIMPGTPATILKQYGCGHFSFEWADASTVGRIREEGSDTPNNPGPRHYGPVPLWNDVTRPHAETKKIDRCCTFICCERAVRGCKESFDVLQEKLDVFDISNRREVMEEAEKGLAEEVEKHRGHFRFGPRGT